MEQWNNLFINATKAFEYYYKAIMHSGADRNGTKTLFNVGFYIHNPLDRAITTPWRKWTNKYAEIEWDWYMSKDRSVAEIKKHAKLWDKMHSGDNIVNSNYGWQWDRNDQLDKCIEQLRANGESRQAYVTIYDGKEKDEYAFDTPCTMSIGFTIIDKRLCMNVHMRSNDLVYGFCNDQYCFSKLQETVAGIMNLEVGWYHHFANDLHIYERHFNLNLY